jgi:hypothetical protein
MNITVVHGAAQIGGALLDARRPSLDCLAPLTAPPTTLAATAPLKRKFTSGVVDDASDARFDAADRRLFATMLSQLLSLQGAARHRVHAVVVVLSKSTTATMADVGGELLDVSFVHCRQPPTLAPLFAPLDTIAAVT